MVDIGCGVHFGLGLSPKGKTLTLPRNISLVIEYGNTNTPEYIRGVMPLAPHPNQRSRGDNPMDELLSATALSDLIGSIYDCVLEPPRWQVTIHAIRRAMNFHNAALSLTSLPSGKHLLAVLDNVDVAGGVDPRSSEFAVASIENWGGEIAAIGCGHAPCDIPSQSLGVHG
jgi:hypothetical protein